MCKKERYGNVIDACKVITDSVLKAKEYSYQILKKAGEKIGTKRKGDQYQVHPRRKEDE
jgi:hypothetical protein